MHSTKSDIKFQEIMHALMQTTSTLRVYIRGIFNYTDVISIFSTQGLFGHTLPAAIIQRGSTILINTVHITVCLFDKKLGNIKMTPPEFKFIITL